MSSSRKRSTALGRWSFSDNLTISAKTNVAVFAPARSTMIACAFSSNAACAASGAAIGTGRAWGFHCLRASRLVKHKRPKRPSLAVRAATLISEFLSPSLGSPAISATSAMNSREGARAERISSISPLANARRTLGSASPWSFDHRD